MISRRILVAAVRQHFQSAFFSTIPRERAYSRCPLLFPWVSNRIRVNEQEAFSGRLLLAHGVDGCIYKATRLVRLGILPPLKHQAAEDSEHQIVQQSFVCASIQPKHSHVLSIQSAFTSQPCGFADVVTDFGLSRASI